MLLALALGPACSSAAKTEAVLTTLRVGVALPPTGVPGTGVPALANSLVREPLVSIGWDGRPVAKLASSWSWSDDRQTLTLQLDPKIKLHDGSTLTPEVAALSLREALKSGYTQYSISFKSVTSVEATEGGKVTIRLSRPEAFLLADLANAALTRPGNDRIGTGPFKYTDLTADLRGAELVKLAAFEEYHRGRPGVREVELQPYQDQRAAWAALMRGDIDAVHEVSPGAMDFLENQTAINTFPHTRPYFIQLLFSQRHRVLKQPLVRQALSRAIDREHIVKVALHGRGLVSHGPIWPQHWAYGLPPKTYTRNTEAATLLLDGAGYRVRPSTEPGRMKSRFRFVCLTLANDARYEKIGILLQKQLFEIGVDMEVVALPARELGLRLNSGNFDALLLEFTSGRSLTWAYIAYHSTLSAGGYRAADAVLDKLRAAPSETETRAAVNEFQRILYDDPPAIFLAWPVVARAVSSTFAVPGESGRDVMGSLWQWRPASRPAP